MKSKPLRCRAGFFHDRQAAGTALTAAVMTLMSLAGIALAGDHIYLVYQRDTLKAATDAASMAAVRHMATLDSALSKAQIEEALQPVARRYILANIPEDKRERAAQTLEIALVANRSAGLVDVAAEADLGGTVFGYWLWGKVVEETQVGSKVERVTNTVEVALAIDVTASMGMTLSEETPGVGEESRMAIVKRAAKELVDILTSTGGDSVAIGLVPWNLTIRLDAETQTRWEDNSWARYPAQQFYPKPYRGSRMGETYTLPPKPEAWQGCVEQRDRSSANPPAFSATSPTESPFTMGFYTPTVGFTNTTVSFQCYPDQRQQYCYDYNARFENIRRWKSPQLFCRNFQGSTRVVPLTTDADKIKEKIDLLPGNGSGATYSTLGIVWGHRLLAPTWRPIWGDPVHPVNPHQHPQMQKALVLLTDGDDTYMQGQVGQTTMAEHRDKACTAAKAAGIKVFTIAAMDPSKVGELANALERCSSQADDPDGQYVFVNNATPEELQGAFQSIAQQLAQFRRIY